MAGPLLVSLPLLLLRSRRDRGFVPDGFGFVGDLSLFTSTSCDDFCPCTLGDVGFPVVDCFSSDKAGAIDCAIDPVLMAALGRLFSSGTTGIEACVIDARLIDFLNPFFCCSTDNFVDAASNDIPVNVG